MLNYMFFLAVFFSASLLNASSIKELTSEDVSQAVNLHMQYKQKDKIDEEAFRQRWDRLLKHPDYSFLAAVENDQPIGFIDFCIFPSLYHNNIIRIDSIYVVDKEKEVFSKFFEKVLEKAKARDVKYIIGNTDASQYLQEERFFNTFMEKQEGQHIAYKLHLNQLNQ